MSLALDIMQAKELSKGMDRNQKAVFYEQKKKSEGIAVLLSFIIPGTGQMYYGSIGKGILIFFLFATTIWIMIGLVPYVYGIYDAYTATKNYNTTLYMTLFSD